MTAPYILPVGRRSDNGECVPRSPHREHLSLLSRYISASINNATVDSGAQR